MKKIFLISVIMAMVFSSLGQGTITIFEYANKRVSFGRKCPVGTYIYLADSAKVYRLSKAQGALSTMNVVFGLGATYYTTIGGGFAGSTSMNITGNAVIGGTLAVAGVASTKTLTVTGGAGISGYLGVTGVFLADSSIQYGDEKNHSWRVWATPITNSPYSYMNLQNLGNISIQSKAGGGQVIILTRDTLSSTAKATISNVATITAEAMSLTAGTITGTATMRGHANFTNTEKVVKVYIPGITSNSYFFVQANQADSTSTVLAADNFTTYVKTDTLVVVRSASGTSGLHFDWFRIK